ncbi:MAG: hypothetical protein ACTSXT_04080 [Candidatus Helarchaeota archaeon]
MKIYCSKNFFVIMLIAIGLIFLILFLPLDILEFLSINIVGGPPINGKTWIEGVYAIGGPISMRILAILGILIILFTIPFILKLSKPKLSARKVNKYELFLFFIIAFIFLFINYEIGYSWWDSNAFLGMGPLFFQSIISLIVLGLSPFFIKKIFKLKSSDFFSSKENLKSNSIVVIIIAFGYGLISLLWHCCSFYSYKMFFFFFIIKLIQLWGICSFFYQWGLNMLLNIVKDWKAYTIISILFGLCYPWHTFGFAITFIFFGFLISYLTRKTKSYYTGLILLYFAYIFHAGLAWNGSFITFSLIYPITIVICLITIFYSSRGILFKK